MSLVKTHKIALVPTDEQSKLMAQHAGFARVAYNHALADFRDGLRNGEWRSERTLRVRFNAVKADLYPWMSELSQLAGKNAIINLGMAVAAWRNSGQTNRFPTFKSRRKHRRAYTADNGPDTIAVDGRWIRLPKLRWVRMREDLRFAGSIRKVTIVQDGGRWFACITVLTDDEPADHCPESAVIGVDVGVRTLATCSNGAVYENPRSLTRNLRQLRRLDRAIARSRHVHGHNRSSRRRDRLYQRRRRLHAKVSNIRHDAQHKATTEISVTGGVIVIEDLNVRGMVRNRRLARSIADAAMTGFHTKLSYKAYWYGARVVVADRWFASSKQCSSCGQVKSELSLSYREYGCECGLRLDRDLNAAINLKNYDAPRCEESINGRGDHVSRPAVSPVGRNGRRSVNLAAAD